MNRWHSQHDEIADVLQAFEPWGLDAPVPQSLTGHLQVRCDRQRLPRHRQALDSLVNDVPLARMTTATRRWTASSTANLRPPRPSSPRLRLDRCSQRPKPFFLARRHDHQEAL
jgi:hypothetical protein